MSVAFPQQQWFYEYSLMLRYTVLLVLILASKTLKNLLISTPTNAHT